MQIKKKIESIGTPLKDWDISINYGIKTGCNEAFIIDTKKRQEILENCQSEQERKATEKLIQKMLRGRDIKRYSYEWKDLWIILAKFDSHKYLEKDYPAIYNHLLQHEEKLRSRGQCRYARGKESTNKGYPGQHHWLELDNNPKDAYLELFAKEKISWQRVTQEPSFVLESGFCLLDSMAFLVSYAKDELMYLLGFLNTKAIFYYFKHIGHLYSDKGFLLSNQYVERFPIPKISHIDEQIHQEIMQCVKEILELKKQNLQSDTRFLESCLDSLIYKLYDLNQEEIDFIESEFKNQERLKVIENLYCLLDTFIKYRTQEHFDSKNNSPRYEGKIIYSEIVQSPQFHLDEEGFFAEATSFILTGERLPYLLGMLHSRLLTFAFKTFYAGGGLGKNGYRYKKAFLEQLPIPKISLEQEGEFVKIVQEILECKKQKQNTEELEKKLDYMVFELYGLSETEIDAVLSLSLSLLVALLLISAIKSRATRLIEILCMGFENELKEVFGFCQDLSLPNSLLSNCLKDSFPSECLDCTLQSPSYQGKIIWAEMTDEPCFIYDNQGMFINQTCYFIPEDNMYLCAVLNSKLIYFYMKQIASNLGDGALRWIKQYVENLPIPKITKENKSLCQKIITLVEQILKSKATDPKNDISTLESQIDSLVYELYNLSQEEISIIEER